MGAILVRVVQWAMAGWLGSVLVGGGLTLIIGVAIADQVEGLLDTAANSIAGLPADMFALAMLSGVGEALTIIGSALMARAALQVAGRILGIRKAPA